MATIFETFNARLLDPDQVAQTFIPPTHYPDVLKRNHTLIVGPRGSGKTTLLKMLTPQGLEAWNHPEADHYRSVIDFTGAFIPTDRSWSEQIKALGGETLEPEFKALFGVATFTTHVLHAVIEAMEYRVHSRSLSKLVPYRRVELSRSSEADLVQQIAKELYLESPIGSLMSLKHALTQRLSKIQEYASAEGLRDPQSRAERLANTPYLHLNFLFSAGSVIELFDQISGERRGKWGLLFDELELAPQPIREVLIKSLRSVNSQLLFKLSMSPFGKDAELFDSEMSATFGNDYNQVALWYAHKEGGYGFCKALLASMLEQNGLPPTEPTKLFGRSDIDTPHTEYGPNLTAYRPGTKLQKRILGMAEKDTSFRRYLERKGIDPAKIHLISDNQRAAVIRKVTSLVLVRDAFRRSQDADSSGKGQQRSRKNLALYSGASSLFAIVEGNPRWFIGIVGSLIDDYARTKSKVIPSKQGFEVKKAINRYRAYLRTIPCPPLKKEQKPRGVLSVLDIIGKYFNDVVVNRDFSADPALSFIVDSRTDDNVMESLGRALNAGAIVYVNSPDSEVVLNSLRGKRFRLTYLLAPYYEIPLILGSPISLSQIINVTPKGKGKQRPLPFTMGGSNE